jgi:hypothetical protein
MTTRLEALAREILQSPRAEKDSAHRDDVATELARLVFVHSPTGGEPDDGKMDDGKMDDGALRYLAYVDDIAPDCPIPPALRSAADAYTAALTAWIDGVPYFSDYYVRHPELVRFAAIDAFLVLGELSTSGVAYDAANDGGVSFGDPDTPFRLCQPDDDDHVPTLGRALARNLIAASDAMAEELVKVRNRYNSGDAESET